MLHYGDCFDVLRTVPDGTVNLVLTDPPYGITDCQWDRAPDLDRLWGEFRRVLAPDGAVVTTACQPFTTALIASNRRWFRYAMVWLKGRSTGFLNARRQPLRAHEDVLVFGPRAVRYTPQMGAGKPYKTTRVGRATETLGDKAFLARAHQTVNMGTRFPTTVLHFPDSNGRGKVHPTQKPVELFDYLVRTYSAPGQLVCDPFAGSGTTGVVCHRTGRRFVGVERERRYHTIARRRIAEAQAEAAAGVS